MEGPNLNPIEQEQLPSHFEFSQIEDTEEREQFEGKYSGILQGISDSVTELKSTLCIEDNGVEEGSQNMAHRYLSELSDDVDKSSRENVDFLDETAERLAYTIRALEYNERGGIPEPENMYPSLKGYDGVQQAFEDARSFLKAINDRQEIPSITETSRKIGVLQGMIEEEQERMTRRVRLAEEYYRR